MNCNKPEQQKLADYWRKKLTLKRSINFRLATQFLILRPLLYVFFKIKVRGVNNILINQPMIIIGNHNSHLDAPLVVGLLPRSIAARIAVGAASDYFFKNRIQGLTSRFLMNLFPVSRHSDARYRGLSDMVVASNLSLLIFPEGTRSRNGQLGVMHQGVARIAINNQVPILPVALKNTSRAWPVGKKIWRLNRPAVEISFLPPIMPTDNIKVDSLMTLVKKSIVENLK